VRRYAKTLIVVAVLLTVSVLILGFERIDFIDRGSEDTLLGLSLGLDLQGGSYLVYQAEEIDPVTGEGTVPSEDAMESLKRSIERRVNASGLGLPIIQRMGNNRLLIQLAGVTDIARAESIIGETAQLVFKHRRFEVARDLDEIDADDIVGVSAQLIPVDEQGRLSTTTDPALLPLPAFPETMFFPETSTATSTATSTPIALALSPPLLIVEFTNAGAAKFAEVVDRLTLSFIESISVDPNSSSAPSLPNRLDVSVEGETPLRFEVTGLSISQIGTTNRFAFPFPADSVGNQLTELAPAQAMLGVNPSIHFTEIQAQVDEPINLTGDDLARAYPSQQSQSGTPIIVLEFKSRGAQIFGELTAEIAGSPTDAIAIFLDDEELISPRVTTAITAGNAIIQGRDFDVERVRDISLLLESGKLPIPITQVEKRTVDAILGADSLRRSVIAGVIGLGLVMLFMVLYYRLPGLAAALALLIYVILVLAIFKIIPITLDLSGVAAIILSVGMAVDANILIFERMKEELRAGRTLTSAVNIGFNRAWPAIRDGNVSTLITCGILFWFADQLGASLVQSFSAALAIGVVTSMFSAIVITRTLLRVIASTNMSRRVRLFVPAAGAQLPQQASATAAQRS
jgi:protein-export membrane protein SecD